MKVDVGRFVYIDLFQGFKFTEKVCCDTSELICLICRRESLYKSLTENNWEVTLAQRLECSPVARETWVQSQVESYQRL